MGELIVQLLNGGHECLLGLMLGELLGAVGLEPTVALRLEQDWWDTLGFDVYISS